MELILFLAAAGLLVWMHGRLVTLESKVRALDERLELSDAAPFPAPEVAEAIVEPEPVRSEPIPAPAPWAALVEPEAEPTPPSREPEPAPARGLAFGFEELFGRRLPIWIGGIALAIAGMLIVRYSIELGLLSPRVRVASGFLFGLGLIGAAEAARRGVRWVRDARVGQALSGAGIATLYATILVAANLYGLIQPLPAFLGLAAVTVLAAFLSLRFGSPSALLGLIGGLAAPALVGSAEPNVPLLAFYLALVVGGLSAIGRSRRWAWLGLLSLIGGFGWGAVLLLAGPLDTAASLSIGLYLALLGIALPAVAAGGGEGRMLRLASSLAAAGQMAWLVAVGGFTLLHWGLFGLISIAMIWLAGRDERMANVPAVGAVLAVLLLGAWPDPTLQPFALAAFGALLVYAGAAMFRVWRPRGSLVDAAQLGGMAVGVMVVTMIQYFLADGSRDASFAILGLGLALVPTLGAWLGWHDPRRREDGRLALLVCAAALLLATAAAFAVPEWIIAPAIALIAASLLELSRRADDPRIEWGGWAGAAASVFVLVITSVDGGAAEISHAAGAAAAQPFRSALSWLAVAAGVALFAWRSRREEIRYLAQAWAALIFYVGAAQPLPADLLPLVPAIALPMLALAGRNAETEKPYAALAVLALLSVSWALLPLAQWLLFGLSALVGDPLFVSELARPDQLWLRLALPGAAMIAAAIVGRFGDTPRRLALGTGCTLLLAAAHSAFKHLFAIDSLETFVTLGLAERLVWEALLLALAVGLLRLVREHAVARRVAVGLFLAAALHLAWFNFGLHNPLWAEQAVGRLPLINLLLPLYGLAAFMLWAAARWSSRDGATPGRGFDIAWMLLIGLFALTELRQLFHGSLLVEPGVPETEEILRSVLAVLLAIGFLVHGIVRGSKDWRIGSLLLMLAAVAKVFLFDAAGLEGLLRILSFVALGLSLIGIGWLYSRYLAGEAEPQRA
jgi:hypothetical protein